MPMKKNIRIIFLPVMICLVSGSFSPALCQVTIVEDRAGEIVLDFILPRYKLRDTPVNGKKCTAIDMPDAACLNERGFPALPYISRSIIIPDNAKMGLEIVAVRYRELHVNTIVPSKGIIYRNQDPADVPHVFSDSYLKDEWYPALPVKLGTPYIIRDIRGIVVSFQPFQYNPVSGKLKIAESIVVRVKKTGAGSINILSPRNKPISPTFDKIYQNRFLNYPHNRTRYPAVDDGERMIIISPTHYLSAVGPLAEWKNKKGIKTTVHDYISETGGGAEGVANFIQEKYSGENLSYVLLIGDIQDILCFYVEGRGGDPIFSLVSGRDNYPDIFVGRLSGESEADIQTMVNKVITYEKEPDPNGEWYHKAMGIASDESQGGMTDKEWMEEFRGTLLVYNYTDVDQVYDPGASISDVSQGLNEGRSWVNYMGHGNKDFWGTTGFSNRHIVELTNSNKLPVIISVACYNGDFSSGLPCFGEAWLRHGSPDEAKGAIVCAASSIMQPWKPPQVAQKEMVKVLCEDAYISVGGIFFNGEMKMLENGDGDNTFKAWNLFGDPSLMVFTDKPTAIGVTCPDKVNTGPQDIDIMFNNSIDGRVCLYSEKSGIVSSKIVSGGSVTLSADIDMNEDKLLLTVTARNKIPFQAEIDVGPSSVVKKHAQEASNSFSAVPVRASSLSKAVHFRFSAPESAAIDLRVYDTRGNRVYKTGVLQPWNLKNMRGKRVAAGMYFFILKVKYESGISKLFKANIVIQ
jgi:hypothetical protein